MTAKVYFTREISPEKVIAMYEALGIELKGKVACKVHSGEEGNQNFLHPEFWKPIIERVQGHVVECNTAYDGARNTTERHKKLMEHHGWTKYFPVDIMDARQPDMVLDIPKGKILKKNYVGQSMKDYNSMLVLSHFKGHPMGGYGGALKQLSIGCASAGGKAYIHSGGFTTDVNTHWAHDPGQDIFLESMADAASSVVEYFKGNMAYISILCNMSVDCDCCAIAEDPCMKDIGILASTDPIAIDQAALDLVYAAKDDPGQAHFLERVESRHGVHTIEAAADLGFGSREYERVDLD